MKPPESGSPTPDVSKSGKSIREMRNELMGLLHPDKHGSGLNDEMSVFSAEVNMAFEKAQNGKIEDLQNLYDFWITSTKPDAESPLEEIERVLKSESERLFFYLTGKSVAKDKSRIDLLWAYYKDLCEGKKVSPDEEFFMGFLFRGHLISAEKYHIYKTGKGGSISFQA